ncbi:MAG: STAS domain-containing protein [Alphaproteobacteria bacterium]|nr:STAS domain-containing protein [Alphaproteobacteria bacterium]
MTIAALFKSIPLATAMIETFERGYDFKKLRADLIAGLVISLVALPLSMALSIAVGLPPQNGLYTAIVAGIVAALLGGSTTQVSGPTAAFVVILAPIVAEFGLRGIVWCQILAGVMLLVLGITRLGKIITYVPHPVTTGFTAGIAVVIATIAMNDFLGVHASTAGHWPEKVWALLSHIQETNFITLGVGLTAFVIMIGLPKIAPKIPSAIVGIAFATVISVILSHMGINIDTLASRFTYTDLAGTTQHGIPPYPPSLHIPGLSADPIFALPSLEELRLWLMPAMVIAALAGLESLLSATVADSMAGTRHEPNAELNGIGLANVASGLFLGIPATGAIARTATNINAGALSPIASTFHALLLLLYMVSLAPLIGYVPMTGLSALLIVTAWRMSHAKHCVHMIKTAPKSDVAVMLVCFFMTVMIDMVAGVVAGVVLAIILFIRRLMMATEARLHLAQNNGTAYALPHDTMLYHIDGPLFFGTASDAFARTEFLTHQATHIVFDMTMVPLIDVTAMNVLEEIIEEVQEAGRQVTLCVSQENKKRLKRRLPAAMLEKIAFFSSVPQALGQHH